MYIIPLYFSFTLCRLTPVDNAQIEFQMLKFKRDTLVQYPPEIPSNKFYIPLFYSHPLRYRIYSPISSTIFDNDSQTCSTRDRTEQTSFSISDSLSPSSQRVRGVEKETERERDNETGVCSNGPQSSSCAQLRTIHG